MGYFLTYISILLFTGCASVSRPNTHQIRVEQDAFVQTGNSPSEEIKSGGSVTLKEDPLIIESPGYVSMMVVPVEQEPISEIQVKLKPITKWGGKQAEFQAQRYSNQVLSEVLAELTSAQIELGKGKAKVALEKVRAIQERYPQVNYLKFFEVSCLTALGKKDEALRLLDTVLDHFPDHKEGRKLYQALSGKEYTGKPKRNGS